ncbi:MAG: alpha/beta fold hydrolase [Nocardiaceae bacterium]|nr:alpha/beta fold hydrolase [Nocardiaceae bacterium]
MKYFVVPEESRHVGAEQRKHLRGSFVSLSDGVTHYELAGPVDGSLVVLIPGLTIPLFYWDELAAALHEYGLQTLAYSAYGRGYSDRLHSTYDENLFVRQLAELVDAVAPGTRCHLVGTSMGALVAMGYVTRHRERVSTLTLAGPAGLAPRTVTAPDRILRNDLLAGIVARRFGRRILEGHLGHNVRDRDLAAKLTEMVLDAYQYQGSIHAFSDTLAHVKLSGRRALFAQTGSLNLPTMLLWGQADEVTPINHAGTARNLLRVRQYHELDCGHMAPYELPHDVAALVASFLQTSSDRIES